MKRFNFICETISRFIKKVFPKRAKSFDEFIKMLKGVRIDSIIVKPQSSNYCINSFPWINDPSPSVMGTIVRFRYGLKFVATTLDGTKIIYCEEISNRLEDASSSVDLNEERKSIAKLLLVGEQRVKTLQAEFPYQLICMAGLGYEYYMDYMDDALI